MSSRLTRQLTAFALLTVGAVLAVRFALFNEGWAPAPIALTWGLLVTWHGLYHFGDQVDAKWTARISVGLIALMSLGLCVFSLEQSWPKIVSKPGQPGELILRPTSWELRLSALCAILSGIIPIFDFFDTEQN